MDIQPETPWDGTPDVSSRIVTAIGRIGGVLRSGVWAFATAEGLNPAQVEILQLLYRRSRGVRLTWLARQLSISSASASDSVTSLVSKGLLRKARDSGDARATALFLTDAGVALASRVGGAIGFADDAAAALPEATQLALLTGLFRMIAQLQQTQHFPELRACLSCRFFEPDKYPGQPTPHHCALVNAPLPLKFLRIDCAEHEPADAASERRNWQIFA
jgi:DNA-binding MarR family transcriptional regulator